MSQCSCVQCWDWQYKQFGPVQFARYMQAPSLPGSNSHCCASSLHGAGAFFTALPPGQAHSVSASAIQRAHDDHDRNHEHVMSASVALLGAGLQPDPAASLLA